MWNGNAVAVGGFLLATTLVPLAGCDIGGAPRNKAAYESRQFRTSQRPVSDRPGAEPRLAPRA